MYDPSYFGKIINILQILKGVCKVLTSTVCMYIYIYIYIYLLLFTKNFKCINVYNIHTFITPYSLYTYPRFNNIKLHKTHHSYYCINIYLQVFINTPISYFIMVIFCVWCKRCLLERNGAPCTSKKSERLWWVGSANVLSKQPPWITASAQLSGDGPQWYFCDCVD